MDYEGTEILRLEQDIEDILTINIDNHVAMYVSDELKAMILEECQAHLGGEFADEFDPVIQEAIELIETSVGPEYYIDEDDGEDD